MNSCVLMATVIRNPELRYTQENQTPIAQMLVEFPGGRADDPPATLKVVAWNNLATEVQENYHEGDQILIEGRLTMLMTERPEGFKEKRAELVASRIHRLDGAVSSPPKVSAPAAGSYQPPSWDSSEPSPAKESEPPLEANLDEIPF